MATHSSIVAWKIPWTKEHGGLQSMGSSFNFSVTKLISAQLYLYPRYDDSNQKYRSGENHDGTFMMFKEWFSLGLTYSF